MPHLFVPEAAPRGSGAASGSGRRWGLPSAAVVDGALFDEEVGGPPTLTVGELAARIARLTATAFPGDLWVEGQIRNLNRSANGHVYFQLAEPTAAGEQPRAQLAVTLLAPERQHVNEQLKRAGGAVRMDDGIEVRIQGRLRWYAPRGTLQLRMHGIDPTFTLGRLQADRDRILAALAAEGLLDANGRLPVLAAVPLRIGLVTSVGSAAHADVVSELTASGIAFAVRTVDARTQGADCAAVGHPGARPGSRRRRGRRDPAGPWWRRPHRPGRLRQRPDRPGPGGIERARVHRHRPRGRPVHRRRGRPLGRTRPPPPRRPPWWSWCGRSWPRWTSAGSGGRRWAAWPRSSGGRHPPRRAAPARGAGPPPARWSATRPSSIEAIATRTGRSAAAGGLDAAEAVLDAHLDAGADPGRRAWHRAPSATSTAWHAAGPRPRPAACARPRLVHHHHRRRPPVRRTWPTLPQARRWSPGSPTARSPAR